MVAPQQIIAIVGCVAIVAVAIALIIVHNTDDDDNVSYKTKVTTADGTTYGTRNYDAATKQATFRGIRYAQAPIGNLRFAPPVKFDYGDTTVDATEYGDICVQGERGPGAISGAEDCLFVNVHVPPSLDVAVTAVDLPVAIWVYGGSFTSGSSNLYDGDALSKYWSDQGVETGIVVTFNYRLNVFGFLGAEAMRERDPVNGSVGNAGIQDQRMAFEWVRDNIASFGGNPANVMLFGESAGSASIVNHLTREQSFGLYSHVVLQSSSFSQFTTLPLHLSTRIFDGIVTATVTCEGLVGSAVVQCLSDLSAYDLFVASWKTPNPNPFYARGYGPVVDGVEALTHPYMILMDKELAVPLQPTWKINTAVDIMQGTNSDEGTSFVPVGPEQLGDANFFTFIFGLNFPFWAGTTKAATLSSFYISSAARALYPPTLVNGFNDFWLGGTRGIGDLTFSCPARRTARALTPLLAANPTASGGPKSLYNYFFEYPITGATLTGLVPHASEIPFVFNSPALPAEDMVMADVMSTAWGNFLTSRDPNAGVAALPGAAAWTPYDTAIDNTFRFKDASPAAIDATPVAGLRMYDGLKDAECDFWDGELTYLINIDFGPGTENGVNLLY